MIPGAFEYHRPASVADAVALMSSLGEDARVLAGGHSLVPMMKLRLAAPQHLVDLGGLQELKGIRADGDEIVIGAMATQHDAISSGARRRIAGFARVLRDNGFRVGLAETRDALSILAIATMCAWFSNFLEKAFVSRLKRRLCIRIVRLERSL